MQMGSNHCSTLLVAALVVSLVGENCCDDHRVSLEDP